MTKESPIFPLDPGYDFAALRETGEEMSRAAQLALWPAPRIDKRASLSPCGLYRYALWRIWDAARAPLVFVMLNPSVADASIDDPTIRRCEDFARREGRGGIVVVNLFAFRATLPAALKSAADPFGPANAHALRTIAAKAVSPVVCAWGAHDMASPEAIGRALAAFDRPGLSLACLGLTASGAPRHPLYVPKSQPLVPFAPARNPVGRADRIATVE